MSQAQPLINDSRLVLLAIVGGMVAFALVLLFVSGGLVRHVDIFLTERTYATLAFQKIDGQAKRVGISGVAGENPTILMRTGDFAMKLTVVNQDNERHALYIDDLGVYTRYLDPEQSEVLTFYKRRSNIQLS